MRRLAQRHSVARTQLGCARGAQRKIQRRTVAHRRHQPIISGIDHHERPATDEPAADTRQNTGARWIERTGRALESLAQLARAIVPTSERHDQHVKPIGLDRVANEQQAPLTQPSAHAVYKRRVYLAKRAIWLLAPGKSPDAVGRRAGGPRHVWHPGGARRAWLGDDVGLNQPFHKTGSVGIKFLGS